jgi:hypothetical protein
MLSLDQPNSAKPKRNAKAKVSQRHRFMICQIRRIAISDIVRLRSNKAPI